MKVNNLNELIDTRKNIEFVSQVLRLMGKHMRKGENIEFLSFMLLQLHSMLNKAATKIWNIESDEVDEVDDGHQSY